MRSLESPDQMLQRNGLGLVSRQEVQRKKIGEFIKRKSLRNCSLLVRREGGEEKSSDPEKQK